MIHKCDGFTQRWRREYEWVCQINQSYRHSQTARGHVHHVKSKNKRPVIGWFNLPAIYVQHVTVANNADDHEQTDANNSSNVFRYFRCISAETVNFL